MNTQSVNKRIIDFIRQHHVLTLATHSNDGPWCASCFYVYDEERNEFIFTTDTHTRHGKEMLAIPRVAGTIALETSIVGKIRGLQFSGKAQLIDNEEFKDARKKYVKAFPFSALVKLSLWKVNPDHFKLTDNRLGFGKKLIWNA